MAVFNGTSGNDSLRGGDANDTLNGLGGNDTLDGAGGIDTLNGGEGNDRLIAATGETALGGAGNDYVVSRGSVATLDGGAGYDILLADGSFAGNLVAATITGFEELKADGGDLAASQLGLFSLISGGLDRPSEGDLNLLAGGSATVNLADSMTRFTLDGSTGDDRLTIRAAYANPVEAKLGGGADFIQSSAGDDELDGEAGSDTMRGGAGADTILATGDAIHGDGGDDYIRTTADGAAVLNGGAGRDMLDLDLNDDISFAVLSEFEELWAGGGSLTTAQLASFGLVSGLSSTSASGSLDLTAGGTATLNLNSTLTQLAVEGSAGNENLTFGPGTATLLIEAGDGADRIIASAGSDVLFGGAGADEIRGGAGDDEIYGNEEIGSVNADRADAAADRLYGEAGNDRVGVHAGDLGDGGVGDDTLEADGAATLLGGDGDDRVVGSTANDSLSGGAGIDTVSYEHSRQPVTVSLATTASQSTGGGGVDTLNGFEDLWGGSGEDRLTGNGVDNVLTGAAGRDRLDGGAGSDTANYHVALSSGLADQPVIVDLRISGAQDTGGSNIDTLISIENLIGGEGSDTLTGNAGANIIEGGDRNDLLDGQGGIDTASYASAEAAVTVSLALTGGQNTVGAGTDTLISFENLRGSAFGDRLTGDASTNRLEGLSGADTLLGGGGIDTLVGGDGNDLYTNDGADEIVESAGGGTDRVQSATSYTLGANVENLTLTGSAASSGTGNTAANLIVGNGVANTLSGGAGNDTLAGGAGTDRLDGGAGADVFDFNGEGDSAAAAPDVLAQFDGAGAAAGDRIDLSGIDANLGLSGDQAFTLNSTAAGGVSLVTSGSDTLVRGNTDGDSAFEFTIRITDGTTLATAYTAADFIL